MPLASKGGMMLQALVLLLPAFVAAQPVGAPPRRVDAIPLTECTVAQARMALTVEASYNAARISEQQMKVLEELRRLVESVPSGSMKPMSDLLSKEELHRFGKLTQQQSAGLLQQLIESRRQRDAEVMLKLIRLADAEWRFSTTPKEGTDDYKVHTLLLLMRVLWSGNYALLTTVEKGPCSVAYAASVLIKEPVARLDALMSSVKEASAWVDLMRTKHKVKDLDDARLSKEEQATLRKLQASAFLPMQSALTFVEDLSNVMLMSIAADIVYDGDRRDAAMAVGDSSLIGTTVQRRVEAGEFDERTQQAIGLWRKINEQFPAAIVEDFKALGNAGK